MHSYLMKFHIPFCHIMVPISFCTVSFEIFFQFPSITQVFLYVFFIPSNEILTNLYTYIMFSWNKWNEIKLNEI